MSQDGIKILTCVVSGVDPKTVFHLEANCDKKDVRERREIEM